MDNQSQGVHWLKELRLQQGISLRQLSKLSGLSKSTLSEIENGINTNPTSKTLSRAAAALGVEQKNVTLAAGLSPSELRCVYYIKEHHPDLFRKFCDAALDRHTLSDFLALL